MNPINSYIFPPSTTAQSMPTFGGAHSPLNSGYSGVYGDSSAFKEWLNGPFKEYFFRDPSHVIDTSKIADNILSGIENLGENFQENFGSLLPSEDSQKPSNQPSTSSGVARLSVEPQTIDYLNAELAKHYGMSAETAYQEALANTSYQRAIKDMQAAGLNPAVLFGSGKGSGADGVSYVASGTTGSGPSGGTTAKSNKKDNLFSEGAFYGISAAIGLVGALLMKNPTGYWIGQSAAQGAMGAANAAHKSG